MDGNGFRKLRITVAAAVAAGVGPAIAHRASAPVLFHPLPFVHTSPSSQTRYALRTGVVGAPFGTHAGFGIGMGSFGHSSAMVTYNHCTHNQATSTCGQIHTVFTASQPRAFDQGFGFSVGGVVFKSPDGKLFGVEPHSTVGSDPVTDVDLLHKGYVVDRFGQNSFRILFSVQNAGTKTVKVPVVVGTNLGSDTNTQVDSSSDRNKAAGRGDTWFVTSDGLSGATPQTLIARGNRNHRGSHWFVKMLAAPGGRAKSDKWVEKRVVTLKPNQTASFLYFTHLYKDAAPATDADTAKYQDGAALQANGLLDGLSAADRALIVNWKSLPPGP